MTDIQPEERPKDHPLEVDAVGTSSMSGELFSPSLTFADTDQGWTVERARENRKDSEEAHRQREETIEAAHKRVREVKDRAGERFQEKWTFIVALGAIVVVLLIGLIIGIGSESTTTKSFGQGLVTLIIGGVVGYAMGRTGKKEK